MRQLVLAAICAAGLSAALSGCGAKDENGQVPATVPREGSIRVVNAMPDAGRMTSFLSTALLSSTDYGRSSPLLQRLVGQYVVNILLTPPSGASTSLVDNAPVNLVDATEVSFVEIGPVATPRSLRIENVAIDFGVDLNKPSAYPPPDYQLVHAATVVNSVDVYVTDAGANIATITPTAQLNFGAVTALVKQDPAITYRVRVTPAGSKTVLFDSGAFNVSRFRRSMYLLLDNFGPTGTTLRVANVTAAGDENFPNQTLASTLRAENAIPDQPAVDVYLGAASGAPLFASLAYGVTSAYLPVPNGDATITVTPAGIPATVLTTGPLSIVGGQARSLYTSGLTADQSVKFTTPIESQREIAGQAQLRCVVAAPSAGSVDVYLLTPGQPVSDASPVLSGAALLSTDTVALSPGAYDYVVTRASSTLELFGPERISVAAGGVYSAVLIDAPGGGSPLTLQVTQETIP